MATKAARLGRMPPDFDPNFQVPHWGWWIVLYFFIGGVTGGVYFAAAWLNVFGDELDRFAMRLGYLLALPLLVLCAIFLAVDLGQPLRFWHMLFQSENFPELMFKPYSPMSFGSGLLAIFGLVAFVSFMDAVLFKNNWLHARTSTVGKVVAVIGAVGGLALASYTGVLLNVANEPVWGNSPWISALFLFSGVSTGMALLMLFARRTPLATIEKLSEADNYMMVFELVSLLLFLVTLGAVGTRFVYGTPVLILFGVVILFGLLAPLALHWRPSLAGGVRQAAVASAVLILIGGFVLRWAVLAAPQGIGL
jgi:formate-dependent nitrite reductase membrane component NrfD